MKKRKQPTHPGQYIREEMMPEAGLNVSEMARSLRISRNSMHKILCGKRNVSPEMALRLGKYFGVSAVFWLDMQQAFDLWTAETKMKTELDKIPSFMAR